MGPGPPLGTMKRVDATRSWRSDGTVNALNATESFRLKRLVLCSLL